MRRSWDPLGNQPTPRRVSFLSCLCPWSYVRSGLAQPIRTLAAKPAPPGPGCQGSQLLGKMMCLFRETKYPSMNPIRFHGHMKTRSILNVLHKPPATDKYFIPFQAVLDRIASSIRSLPGGARQSWRRRGRGRVLSQEMEPQGVLALGPPQVDNLFFLISRVLTHRSREGQQPHSASLLRMSC